MRSSHAPSEINFKVGRSADAEGILDLFRAWRVEGDESKRAEIIEAGVPLVVFVARLYRSKLQDPPFADMVSEGTTGLIRAVDKFDLDRGLAFSTYAFPWIRQALRRARQRNRIIHIPFNLQDAALSERATARRIAAGEATTFSALADDFDPIADDDASKRIDRGHVDHVVGQVLGSSPVEDQIILCLRLGLRGFEPHSSVRIGRMLGISERTVSGRVADAIKAARLRKDQYADVI